MAQSSKIVIVGQGAVSPLGLGAAPSFISYSNGKSHIETREGVPVAALDGKVEEAFREYIDEYSYDRVAYLAQMASDQALAMAHWTSEELSSLGVFIGSSRGTTGLWESFFKQFLYSEKQRVSPNCSPLTTFGSISSSVARRLKLSGATMDQSVTCSSGLAAILNAVAMIKGGFSSGMLAGGSEAPITDFTIAQMKALRIYTKINECRPLSCDEKDYDSFMLGEGAAMFALELASSDRRSFYRDNQCPVISGIGVAQEIVQSQTGISDDGVALQQSMKRALLQAGKTSVDAIFLHAPGTKQGDQAELGAIAAVFSGAMPQLLSTKWLVGHCFAASGPLSLLCAMALLKGFKPPEPPYKQVLEYHTLSEYKSIMVNATGFGGNAVSLVIELPTWE